ncbi:energy transducer TonB, partial [Vicingaceae bacterium]|nr:energy transducer TonB [Vicingaceae bacterium]
EADMDTEIFEQPEEVIEEAEIFMIVENMPLYPGCEKKPKAERDACTQLELQRFIANNTVYPPMAKDAGITGRVFITFVIDQKGKVSDVAVLKGVAGGKALDKEATRVVEALPTFTPGEQRGKKAKVRYNIPVNFTLR